MWIIHDFSEQYWIVDCELLKLLWYVHSRRHQVLDLLTCTWKPSPFAAGTPWTSFTSMAPSRRLCPGYRLTILSSRRSSWGPDIQTHTLVGTCTCQYRQLTVLVGCASMDSQLNGVGGVHVHGFPKGKVCRVDWGFYRKWKIWNLSVSTNQLGQLE